MGLLQERCAKYTLPQEFMAQGIYPYFREIEGKQGTEVMMDGHRVLMFGSNAYTGLTGDQRVIDAGIAAMQRYGSGCAGSRFLNGTLDIHVQLEKELAEFVGKDETLCFPTGFTVNSGVISQLVDRNDYIICDDRDHASIVDGRRLSFATQLKFKHNDMEDLEKQLQKCEPNRVKLIIVDGVFSMEGDLCNLPAIIELKKKYNATVMVDEAHGLGVFGRQGRGVCDHFGLTKEVDLIMGTFSKSLASIGGFIAADSSIINWLRHTCRTYIFSASCTPAATAAAREALRIIQAEPERLEALWNVTKYALKRFREEGFEIGDTESPIIPLYVRNTDKTFMAVARAFEEGVFINPVIPPACAPQDTLVRYALMANHTFEQVDESVEKLKKVFKELEII
ncbi:MAG: aminotransferase class I/II-fold pyridoxal phosphate-dependent enzyme [Bacteroidaceae bacterium]|mgnify:FL=1|jgi:8-amino-7-oxononanoate synthase|nr:aminotransferase class I/II-fold pyridoxal phosphate-dependent enzyme [Bacteroidaceae bacterium]MBO5740687.1 aminotransferase class I/II-fold pyridoxal phosphate-dependent enzyme [Bacteroidaceae bacterium]MBO5886322.1 aminotransferase class I/II-fold pyridoxal phosphate-dependent enzyme [Bacteroidaceae bacterium]MBO7171467.1 aminotransferase class I/II-fold pyridoxal phosphate-dependent enzyme [Bacteroidaceae bacterium]MBQ5374718.1 aminotransferase class I/II-fold pyridoxal phosphate-depende